MDKRGQLQLSFSMLFSIIIIIATIAVAIYFISNFLETSRCAQINLFKNNLQEKIDEVWRSAQAQQTFEINLPTKVDEVCFGSVAQAGNEYQKEFAQLRRYSEFEEYDLFLLPNLEACGGSSAISQLKHVEKTSFFCINLKNGKGDLNLIKETSAQSLVKLKNG